MAVTEVARRYGVARQTVHRWLERYAADGIDGLVDRSSRPGSCPHQMPAGVEARVVELRRAHPSWGPRTIGFHLAKEGVSPVPGRSSIYRALLRRDASEKELVLTGFGIDQNFNLARLNQIHRVPQATLNKYGLTVFQVYSL